MMYLATLAQAENASARQRVAAMSAEAPPALAKLGRCLSQPRVSHVQPKPELPAFVYAKGVTVGASLGQM